MESGGKGGCRREFPPPIPPAHTSAFPAGTQVPLEVMLIYADTNAHMHTCVSVSVFLCLCLYLSTSVSLSPYRQWH